MFYIAFDSLSCRTVFRAWARMTGCEAYDFRNEISIPSPAKLVQALGTAVQRVVAVAQQSSAVGYSPLPLWKWHVRDNRVARVDFFPDSPQRCAGLTLSELSTYYFVSRDWILFFHSFCQSWFVFAGGKGWTRLMDLLQTVRPLK